MGNDQETLHTRKGQRNANHPSDTSLEAMRTVYDTNVFGVVAVTKAMLPLLRKSRLTEL